MSISAKDVQELRRRTGAGMMDCKKALQEANGDMEKAIKLLKEWGIAKASKKSGREASEGVLIAIISENGKNGALIEVNCETDFVANTNEYKTFAQQVANTIFTKGIKEPSALDTDIQNMVNEGISKFGENIIINSIKNISTSGRLFSYIHTNQKLGTIVALTGNDLNSPAVEELGKDIAVHITANKVIGIDEKSVDPKLLEEKRKEFDEELAKQNKPENMRAKIVEGKISKFLKEETLYNQPFFKNEEITIKQLIEQKAKGVTVEGFIKTTIGE
ncbi:MAG TPA: translation elongation factor Ts [Spirochaetota bacterium]|nr:translation elongation factor Ts [Spirochaetota bacterium]HOM39198.1 translation elongation factor Ts [Spirochaetota bacterium]HPQ49233.1 translation elongation factor Ts [Spirochaetota bacterium]